MSGIWWGRGCQYIPDKTDKPDKCRRWAGFNQVFQVYQGGRKATLSDMMTSLLPLLGEQKLRVSSATTPPGCQAAGLPSDQLPDGRLPSDRVAERPVTPGEFSRYNPLSHSTKRVTKQLMRTLFGRGEFQGTAPTLERSRAAYWCRAC